MATIKSASAVVGTMQSASAAARNSTFAASASAPAPQAAKSVGDNPTESVASLRGTVCPSTPSSPVEKGVLRRSKSLPESGNAANQEQVKDEMLSVLASSDVSALTAKITSLFKTCVNSSRGGEGISSSGIGSGRAGMQGHISWEDEKMIPELAISFTTVLILKLLKQCQFSRNDSGPWPLSPESLNRLADIEKDRAKIRKKLDTLNRECGKALYQLLKNVIVYLAGSGFCTLFAATNTVGQVVCWLIVAAYLVAVAFAIAIFRVMTQCDAFSHMSCEIDYVEYRSADLIKKLKKELKPVTGKQTIRDRMDLLERPITGRYFMMKWVIGIGVLILVSALIFIAAMWLVCV